jgi:hypothetical protein
MASRILVQPALRKYENHMPGSGDPKVDYNNWRSILVREGPMDLLAYNSYTNNHPEYTPEEQLRDRRTLSFPQLQAEMAARLEVNQAKFQLEVGGQARRKRRINTQFTSLDGPNPTMTPKSDWYRQALLSNQRVFGNTGFDPENSRKTNK